MHRFYRYTAVIFSGLLVLIVLTGYVCLQRAFFDDALLPAQQSVIPWTLLTDSDAIYENGGSSSITVNDSSANLDYDFRLGTNIEFPYASVMLVFNSRENPGQLANIEKYSTISLNIKCTRHSVLSFTIFSFDEKITKPDVPMSFRIPTGFFTCDENWTQVEMDLRHLEIQDWWLRQNNLELPDKGYRLDKVGRFAIGVSPQSPLEASVNVKIRALNLRGHDRRYLSGFFAALITACGALAWWFFRRKLQYLIGVVRRKTPREQATISAQQLSIEPQKKKDRRMVMQFMATEYANPDMSLDMAITKLGFNHNKINEMLKEEADLTFTAYLNKLRLAEAARLLCEEEQANISEVSRVVGYSNVSYFIRLFKAEYGCTPKQYKRKAV